ncbi:MAG TPA: DUF1028 domain-containing protein [Bryobacteraceae bacterium]|nr:DUF1028 domain-containing protein [Bryobacteraceae bacterium]
MIRSLLLLVGFSGLAAAQVATFSIVAYDPQNADWGVAVASRYFSVGSVVPWAAAQVGAIATQANVNVGYGPRGLELLGQGHTAKEVLDQLLAEDKFDGKDGRQVAVVDAKGNIAAYTGPGAPKWAGDRQGKTWSAQGNILVGPQVVESMGRAFDQTPGELAEKLYAAVKAGDEAGGDARGKQSASMLVVRKQGGRNTNNDRYIYINVDDNPAPLPELRRLLDLNLGYLYQDKTFKLLGAGKISNARDAAAQAARYWPNRPEAHVTLGLLDYAGGDKSGALAELKTAQSLSGDSNFRRQFEGAAQRTVFKGILDDKPFLKQLFGEQAGR